MLDSSAGWFSGKLTGNCKAISSPLIFGIRDGATILAEVETFLLTGREDLSQRYCHSASPVAKLPSTLFAGATQTGSEPVKYPGRV